MDDVRSNISNAPKTLAYVPLDATHILACKRVHLPTVQFMLPEKYLGRLQEEAPNPCCHEAENLDIEAWFSSQARKDEGAPNIYKFYCKVCEACHVRFCLGGGDIRPVWEIG